MKKKEIKNPNKDNTSFVVFNNVSYEFTDDLVNEVFKELEARGWGKEDVTEDEFQNALRSVLVKKQDLDIIEEVELYLNDKGYEIDFFEATEFDSGAVRYGYSFNGNNYFIMVVPEMLEKSTYDSRDVVFGQMIIAQIRNARINP